MRRVRKLGPASRRRRTRRALRLRDGDSCWLCQQPMRFEPGASTGPVDPGCATIDHIIPWSKGGSNALTNLRLAHSNCNEKRGASDA